MARHPQSRKAPRGTATPSLSADSSTVAATRVCIKNIPPSFTSTRLRDYLLKEFQVREKQDEQRRLVITDCHVLMDAKKKQSRRIAFVGLQTPQMTQAVIRLFHRTFALTSKLSVEPAHGANQQQNNNNKQQKEKGHKEQKDHLPVNDQQQEKDVKTTSSKIKDTVSSMTSKNAKFWSNDFDQGLDEQKPTHQVNIANLPTDDHVNQDDDDDQSSRSSNASISDDENEEDYADPLANKINHNTHISDMDFLRSKQTMVEDLDDNEENANEKENEEGGGSDDDQDSSSQSSSDSDSSDDDELVNEETITTDKAKDNNNPDGMQQQDAKDTSATNNERPDEAHSSDNDDDNQVASNRLFVRNLAFATTEEELQEHFSSFGSIEECHIPVDDRKQSKGFGFVSFEKKQDAIRALEEMDGTDFQGRYLHVVPSRKPPHSAANEDDNMNNRPFSYKERQELARQQAAAKSDKGWSASFVRGDAVVDSLADRLGIKKGDILNVKDGLGSGDAAVRLALGETQVIEENREYFRKHSIEMEALVPAKRASGEATSGSASSKRSKTSILVKNLPYDTQLDELIKVFHQVGDAPKRILLPPSRTIALVEYGHGSDAKRAFRRLAYKRFKNVPLYLEWAPLAASASSSSDADASGPAMPSKAQSPTGMINNTTDTSMNVEAVAHEEDDDEKAVLDGPTPTLYIKNLNFSTTEDKLRHFLEKHVKDVRAISIPRKAAPIRKPLRAGGAASQSDDDAAPGDMQSLSMGYGFVEFASQESARVVLKKLQGTYLDGHKLELKPSMKSLVSKAIKPPSSKTNPTKVAVRNVPFQATRTELLKLFGSFGQLKRVRLPKKFDGGHRGFAFVEFVTHKEALSAMKSLSQTHLYGRHLVLEWAEEDDNGPARDGAITGLREKAQRDVSNLDTNGQNKRQRRG